VIILLRLKVGVTGNDDELLLPLTAIGFLSNTELLLLGLCWIAQISPVIGLRLIGVNVAVALVAAILVATIGLSTESKILD